ncbi:hypothetical protein ACXZ9C_11585 [Streptococcus agalactiae]
MVGESSRCVVLVSSIVVVVYVVVALRESSRGVSGVAFVASVVLVAGGVALRRVGRGVV